MTPIFKMVFLVNFLAHFLFFYQLYPSKYCLQHQRIQYIFLILKTFFFLYFRVELNYFE